MGRSARVSGPWGARGRITERSRPYLSARQGCDRGRSGGPRGRVRHRRRLRAWCSSIQPTRSTLTRPSSARTAGRSRSARGSWASEGGHGGDGRHRPADQRGDRLRRGVPVSAYDGASCLPERVGDARSARPLPSWLVYRGAPREGRGHATPGPARRRSPDRLRPARDGFSHRALPGAKTGRLGAYPAARVLADRRGLPHVVRGLRAAIPISVRARGRPLARAPRSRHARRRGAPQAGL